MMLERLKNLDTDGPDMDDLVELAAFADSLQATYTRLEVEPPSWLETRVRALHKEIKIRESDRLEKALLDLESQGAADLTAEERRASRKEQIDKLKARLASR